MTRQIIPFYDLTKEYAILKKDIASAISNVLSTQQFILGPQLQSFEKEFARFLGVKYCVGVGSGTDGLILALLSLGITKGDEVIIQANTFIATAYAVSIVGATPILVDVDPLTHQINPSEILKKVTKKTKAIIPVHLFGSPAPMGPILDIAKKYSLKIIEDACQAHGGEFNGKMLGSFGDISVFSFYPSKNLGAYGDGGAICTNSKLLYKKLLLLRNYGQRMKYEHVRFGTNTRLDEIQAAVLRVKLKYLKKFITQRRMMAKLYDQKLEGVLHPEIIPGGKSAYHLYVVTHPARTRLRAHLMRHGITTLIHYPIPIHKQRVYREEFSVEHHPISERLAKTSLSLPFFVGMTKGQFEYVIAVVNSFS